MIGWAMAAMLAASFLLSGLLCAVLMPLARATGYLDRPAAHKAHARATPLLGGPAIHLAVAAPVAVAAIAALAWGDQPPAWLGEGIAVHVPGAAEKAPIALGIVAVGTGLLAMGLIDDRRPLGPWIKLGVQLAAALVTAAGLNVRVMTFAGGPVSLLVTTVWLVVIINAFNFLDNMDGLSGGVAAICSAALLMAAGQMGQLFVSAWLAALVGALLGFLPYNFPPARMFMGDAGSLVIGYLLGVLSCLTTYAPPGQGHFLYGVFVPAVLLAVPLYDTLSVMIIRLRLRLNPMVGDRRHFSHRLVRRGMSVRRAVATIYLCTLTTGMGAMLLPHTATVTGAVLVFVQTVAVLGIVALLESGGRVDDD